MTYTVWMHGRRIGDTQFELAGHFQRRAGSFRPTPHGLTVLPGLTAMFPALLEFADMCRRNGVAVDDNWSNSAAATADAFGDTPEAQRVFAAAERIAEVEVRDPTGRRLAWQSLAISELDAFIPITAAPGRLIHEPMTRVKGDRVRYMISLNLSTSEMGAPGLFSTVTRPRQHGRIWQQGWGMADPR